MTIDINGLSSGTINTAGGSNQTSGAGNDARSDKASSSLSTTNADKVSLTSSATHLNALEEKIGSLPVVDTQRVAETRHALATGSHKIDPTSTADNLLATERAFAQK